MDTTEPIRRKLVSELNDAVVADIIAEYGVDDCWTTTDLTEDFEVIGFMAPFVVVKRKSDGKKGSLMFKHSPRIYFGWKAD